MIKFKKGDTVKVTSGKDKGREGKIEKVISAKSRLLIPGINIYKKHVKANLTVDGKGGVYELPRPLDMAKVAIICPNCKKQTRVGFEVIKGKKERICRKCKKQI